MARAAALAAASLVLAGCALLDQDGTGPVSVFDAEPGDCFLVPEEITAELTQLTGVGCAEPHDQEAYAVVEYTPAEGADGYPGDAVLKDFADGSCAAEFAPYVGVDYRDSSLFFTYLLPSVRSWEQGDDRSVTCFITTTGEPLVDSVEGSEL
ncbi:septum formation family protein [Georgenia yuyongxinii]